jgi:hypothetical protein
MFQPSFWLTGIYGLSSEGQTLGTEVENMDHA